MTVSPLRQVAGQPFFVSHDAAPAQATMLRFPFISLPEWVHEPFHPWTLYSVLLAAIGSLTVGVALGGF
jgi:hypothetical protein